MKQYFYFTILTVATISSIACKKETVAPPFDDVFNKPYSTGIIKLEYQTPVTGNESSFKDTTVEFTSTGNNSSETDLYGYAEPSIQWVQLHRLNPDDFQNRAFIYFEGTNLNSLILPYTFNKNNLNTDAVINYVIGLNNSYAANTFSDNFELTVLSRTNNRLQGTFSGEIKNQDGNTIVIKKGLFDIVIVEK